MPSKYHERRSLSTALKDYLQDRGWNIDEVKEGFQFGGTVVAPAVSVYFQPSSINELEMGRNKRHTVRRIQIDAYMLNESTADEIGEDIMDFLDEVPIVVRHTTTSGELGSMLVYDTGSIVNETVPPIYKEASVKHWRNVSKATYEVHYF